METSENQFDSTSQPSRSDHLKQAKNEMDELKFKYLINRMLPELRKYIARRLNMAHSTGLIDKYRIIPEDVIDLVYLELYEKSEKFAGEKNMLDSGVYRIVDEVLDKQLNERAFEKEHLIELQKIEDIELSGLEEKFTVDAEGELIMDEDLDDVSYKQKLYDPVEFIEDNETIESIEASLSEFDKKRLHEEIQRQLISLPEEDRTIFDLFWIVGLSMNKISGIRKIPVTQVEESLKRVGAHVRKKISGRFK